MLCLYILPTCGQVHAAQRQGRRSSQHEVQIVVFDDWKASLSHWDGAIAPSSAKQTGEAKLPVSAVPLFVPSASNLLLPTEDTYSWLV